MTSRHASAFGSQIVRSRVSSIHEAEDDFMTLSPIRRETGSTISPVRRDTEHKLSPIRRETGET